VQHPVAREILTDAQCREGDVHWRKNLPYYSTTFAGDGFALVGDAAAFLDPFYSPGMDWISFTVSAASELVLAQRRGEQMGPLAARHNADFARSYDRWFQAIYQDKYDYMGEFDLMRLAFLLDVGLYCFGVVSQPFKRGFKSFLEPIFSTKPSVPFFYFIRCYNRRLAQIARSRRKRGVLGRRNANRRFLFQGYTFARTSTLPIAKAIVSWALLEVREGWRSWFRPAASSSPQEVPLTAATQSTP
jgi:hypothetical protein